MSYDSYSRGSRSANLDTALGEFLPGAPNILGLRGVGAVGGGLFVLYAAQWLMGALLGAGVTWGSAHATMTGQPGLLSGSYSRRLRPNFTIGSTYVRAGAGDVLHLDLDADIRAGEIDVRLSRVPGFVDVQSVKVQKSGATSYDFKIPEAGYYTVTFSTWGARTGAAIRSASGAVVTEDLSYRLDWRLTN